MAVNGLVGVQVVGEDQRRHWIGGARDGPVSAGNSSGQWVYGGLARVDDGARNRRGTPGPIRRVGRHAHAPSAPGAAADRPYITASAHQFTHDGAADGTRCAEDNVPRTAQLRHRDYPSPGTGIARPANPRVPLKAWALLIGMISLGPLGVSCHVTTGPQALSIRWSPRKGRQARGGEASLTGREPADAGRRGSGVMVKPPPGCERLLDNSPAT
jgi:hypothetical protein